MYGAGKSAEAPLSVLGCVLLSETSFKSAETPATHAGQLTGVWCKIGLPGFGGPTEFRA